MHQQFQKTHCQSARLYCIALKRTTCNNGTGPQRLEQIFSRHLRRMSEDIGTTTDGENNSTDKRRAKEWRYVQKAKPGNSSYYNTKHTKNPSIAIDERV